MFVLAVLFVHARPPKNNEGQQNSQKRGKDACLTAETRGSLVN